MRHLCIGPLIVFLLTCALTLLGALGAPAAWAQRAYQPAPWAKDGPSRPEDLSISLVTFGPGDDVPSWFGHSALGVEDARLGVKRLYNYGMFTFDSLMVLRFIKGRLDFWVGPSPYEGTLRAYASHDRDVRIQVLELTPERAAEIAQFLEWNILPEHRGYLYDHYRDNCSTRLRDIVDKASAGALKAHAQATPSRMSLRDHTRRHAVWPILDFGMMFAMASPVDSPITIWDEMFLPAELERQLAALRVKGEDGQERSLVRSTSVFHQAQHRPATPEAPATLWPWLLLIGASLGALAWALAWRHARGPTRATRVVVGLYAAALGLAFGGAGALLLMMWTLSDHVISYRNENLLWTNPLMLAALWFGLSVARGKHRRARARLARLWMFGAASAALGLALKALPWFNQDNWMTVALMAPLHVGLFLASREIFCEGMSPSEVAAPAPLSAADQTSS